MSKQGVAAGAAVVGVLVLAVAVWGSMGGMEPAPQAPAVPETPDADAPVPESSRASGAQIPQSIRRDVIRRRERMERAIALGLTVDGKPRQPARATAEEEPVVAWATDRAGIEQAMASAVPLMYECLDGYGPEVGAFAGEVTAVFSVGSADENEDVAYAEEVTLDGQDVPPAVTACVTSVLSGLSFEPSDSATSVTYPLALEYGD